MWIPRSATRRERRVRAHLARHGRPSRHAEVPPPRSFAATPRPCSWSRPPRSSASPSLRDGAIRRVDLLYLPAVLATAVLAGLGPALFAALASALAYNFFFTAPHLTFRIENPNDVVTVVVLFAVAVVTSQLAASVRRQARIARSPCGPQRDHRRARAAAARPARRSGRSPRSSTRELGEVFECNAVLVARTARTAPAFQRAGADRS